MKDEYVIVNKTDIQKRIEELQVLEGKESMTASLLIRDEIETLKRILSYSTPLIPEIEKAINSGIRSFEPNAYEMPELIEEIKQDYILNLKLDIWKK